MIHAAGWPAEVLHDSHSPGNSQVSLPALPALLPRPSPSPSPSHRKLKTTRRKTTLPLPGEVALEGLLLAAGRKQLTHSLPWLPILLQVSLWGLLIQVQAGLAVRQL